MCMIGYTFKFRGLFLSSLVVVHMDFRMRLDRNIKLMWEPAGERKDIGSFPTHCSRWIVFICQSITKRNEENFPQFSSLQTFAFLCLRSQQLIVPKLPKVVVASCLFRFRHSQTQFGKWLYQSQVLKFAKGSSMVQEAMEKISPSAFTGLDELLTSTMEPLASRLSPASLNVFKPQHAEPGSLPICFWEYGNKSKCTGGIRVPPWKTGKLEK